MDTLSAPRRYSVPAAHEARPRLCLPAIVVALFSLLAVGGPAARAQGGTPTAGLDAPAAAECTVAPRSEDELQALFRKAAATPIPTSLELAASPTPAIAPLGDPADEQTVAEISATWREFIACISAGDQARLFALFSDDMVLRQFVVDIAFGVTEDALFDFLSATPVPLPLDQSTPIVPFDDVRVLSDGRVAIVGPGELGRGDVRIFVKAGDRWLLDEWFDLTANGTPAAGMPMIEPTPYG
jgi:ketosteroid isomerase-like protein